MDEISDKESRKEKVRSVLAYPEKTYRKSYAREPLAYEVQGSFFAFSA
jgi:hypothetical protein